MGVLLCRLAPFVDGKGKGEKVTCMARQRFGGGGGGRGAGGTLADYGWFWDG